MTLCCLSISACGKKNPVEVVTAEVSGVTVVEPTTFASDTDWAGWRGPQGDGSAPPQDFPTKWNESTNIAWRVDVPGRGHSSPIVVGDTVYLATADDASEEQMVLAYQRDDGTELWRTVIHKGGFPSRGDVHQKATNANGTLACDGQQLFIAMLNGEAIHATALTLEGDIVWQKEIGKYVSRFGYAPSPVLYKSLVIFAAENSGGGYLAALDSETGTVAWRIPRGEVDSYSTPAIDSVGGRDQLLITGADAVTSYDPATGEKFWSTECISESTCGTVITSGDRIFASGGYPKKETVCLSADGQKLWSARDKVYEPSMVVHGNHLIAVKDDGVAMCWDTQTGDLFWKKRLGGNFSASPVVIGDIIIVPNLEGETLVFRAADDFELISKNSLGNDAYASPAVSNSQIFLRIGVGEGPNRREELVCIAEPLKET